MLSNYKISVVLPAAGTGQRIGISTPKQYIIVAGLPLYQHTLHALLRIDWIDEIILVVEEKYQLEINNVLKNDVSFINACKISVICGDRYRHRSINNGIKSLESANDHIVIVHDVVRPIVNESILRPIVEQAIKYGACGVTRPLTSTVISATEDGFLSETLDRNRYRASETPQAFRYAAIRDAYDRATDDELENGTECLQLVLKYVVQNRNDENDGGETDGDETATASSDRNVRIKLIEGDSTLWKVTYYKDILALENIINNGIQGENKK